MNQAWWEEESIGQADWSGLPLLMGFTGFSDAGQVVRQVSDELLDQLQAEVIAIFDVDQLIDYRSRRPQISFVKDHLADYQQPRLVLYRMLDSLGRPFLFLTGNEPDLQWERFSAAVIGLVEQLDVSLVAWVHAIPMPVPHTRPIGVTVHGNQPELIQGISSWQTTVNFPSGIGHLLEVRLIEAGRDVAGYAVHVPHYLAEAEYPGAAVAALEYLGAAAALMLPSERLRESGRAVEQQITAQVEASAEVQGVVGRLEQNYDERTAGQAPRSLLAAGGSADELPDVEELAADIESYLATLNESESSDSEPSEES
ncbi:PAC2 family protein [Acaricomes phytoseiuli]|nr:PAC2 family protein [Acaricomes phytoseiuli]MCW1249105.1 PAC2 family protein [Acaricomes phytoseiuli]